MKTKPLLIAVDDELDMAKLVADVAEMSGFEVRYVESVRHFLRITRELAPDVIVTDICMPDTDGIELLQQLAEQGCHAGIILISGYEGRYLQVTELIARDRHLQLLGKLQKPYRLDELKGLMNLAMDWCKDRGQASV